MGDRKCVLCDVILDGVFVFKKWRRYQITLVEMNRNEVMKTLLITVWSSFQIFGRCWSNTSIYFGRVWSTITWFWLQLIAKRHIYLYFHNFYLALRKMGKYYKVIDGNWIPEKLLTIPNIFFTQYRISIKFVLSERRENFWFFVFWLFYSFSLWSLDCNELRTANIKI